MDQVIDILEVNIFCVLLNEAFQHKYTLTGFHKHSCVLMCTHKHSRVRCYITISAHVYSQALKSKVLYHHKHSCVLMCTHKHSRVRCYSTISAHDN